MGEPWSVLVVEDSISLRERLAASLEAVGATALLAGSVTEAVALLMERPVALAVVGLELPGEQGLSVLQHLRDRGPGHHEVPVIMLSTRDDLERRLEAFRLGADDFLVKPFDVRELAARATRLHGTFGHIASLEAAAARLLELSVTDGLTQIGNHRAFQEHLKDEFRRAQRYDDPLALILLDVDHFKLVNDQHGHQVGDEVLKGLADTMRAAVRETDFVARYGGEEFAVVLPKTHLAGALTVAERISVDFRALRLGPTQVKVTASFGVSSFPGRAVNTPEQLLRTADEALFRSKREGRNKISLYQAAFSTVAL
jgi:diguanylate cyclase (GGDEF)-like protein